MTKGSSVGFDLDGEDWSDSVPSFVVKATIHRPSSRPTPLQKQRVSRRNWIECSLSASEVSEPDFPLGGEEGSVVNLQKTENATRLEFGH